MNGPILLNLKWTHSAIINNFLSISSIRLFIGRFQFGNQFYAPQCRAFSKILYIF